MCVWDSWGSECAASGFVLCVGQLGGVSVQQVALCCVCRTVGVVGVQEVALCCVWESWGSEGAAGCFVLCVGQLGEWVCSRWLYVVGVGQLE